MKKKSKHKHSLSEFYFTNKPRRSVMLMNRYSNELVITNTFNQQLKKENPSAIFSRYSTASTASRNKKESIEEVIINGNEVKDESDIKDEDNYNNNYKPRQLYQDKKRTKYGITTKNPEMDLVYMRLNDLRKLELNYSKDSHKKGKGLLMNSSTLNEIYYKFKKRFLRSQKAKSVYTDPRTSLKTDRNLPTLVTSSNVSTPKSNSNINVHNNYKPSSTAMTSQFVKTASSFIGNKK